VNPEWNQGRGENPFRTIGKEGKREGDPQGFQKNNVYRHDHYLEKRVAFVNSLLLEKKERGKSTAANRGGEKKKDMKEPGKLRGPGGKAIGHLKMEPPIDFEEKGEVLRLLEREKKEKGGGEKRQDQQYGPVKREGKREKKDGIPST